MTPSATMLLHYLVALAGLGVLFALWTLIKNYLRSKPESKSARPKSVTKALDPGTDWYRPQEFRGTYQNNPAPRQKLFPLQNSGAILTVVLMVALLYGIGAFPYYSVDTVIPNSKTGVCSFQPELVIGKWQDLAITTHYIEEVPTNLKISNNMDSTVVIVLYQEKSHVPLAWVAVSPHQVLNSKKVPVGKYAIRILAELNQSSPWCGIGTGFKNGTIQHLSTYLGSGNATLILKPTVTAEPNQRTHAAKKPPQPVTQVAAPVAPNTKPLLWAEPLSMPTLPAVPTCVAIQMPSEGDWYSYRTSANFLNSEGTRPTVRFINKGYQPVVAAIYSEASGNPLTWTLVDLQKPTAAVIPPGHYNMRILTKGYTNSGWCGITYGFQHGAFTDLQGGFDVKRDETVVFTIGHPVHQSLEIKRENNVPSLLVSSPGSMSLRADSRGHYSVKGYIDDLPTNFLVDTGASNVAISRELANKLKITDCTPSLHHTANGNVMGCTAVVKQISFGIFAVQDVTVAILPKLTTESLLGMGVLRKFKLSQQDDYLKISTYDN